MLTNNNIIMLTTLSCCAEDLHFSAFITGNHMLHELFIEREVVAWGEAECNLSF